MGWKLLTVVPITSSRGLRLGHNIKANKFPMKPFLMLSLYTAGPPQVAQYLNLELPILEQVLLKLREEENREIQRIVGKSVRHLCVSSFLFQPLRRSDTFTAGGGADVFFSLVCVSGTTTSTDSCPRC